VKKRGGEVKSQSSDIRAKKIKPAGGRGSDVAAFHRPISQKGSN